VLENGTCARPPFLSGFDFDMPPCLSLLGYALLSHIDGPSPSSEGIINLLISHGACVDDICWEGDLTVTDIYTIAGLLFADEIFYCARKESRVIQITKAARLGDQQLRALLLKEQFFRHEFELVCGVLSAPELHPL
jgi:hypothetical protein